MFSELNATGDLSLLYSDNIINYYYSLIIINHCQYITTLGALCYYYHYACCAFSIVGPSTWNGLPLAVCLLSKNKENALCKLLKTDLYRSGWAVGASE